MRCMTTSGREMGRKYRSGNLIRWVEAVRKMKSWNIPKDSEEGPTELGLRPQRRGCCPDGASGRWADDAGSGLENRTSYTSEVRTGPRPCWQQGWTEQKRKPLCLPLALLCPLWQSGQEASWQGNRAFVLQEPQPQHHSRQGVSWELRGQWLLSLTRLFSLSTVESGARCCPQRNSWGTRRKILSLKKRKFRVEEMG